MWLVEDDIEIYTAYDKNNNVRIYVQDLKAKRSKFPGINTTITIDRDRNSVLNYDELKSMATNIIIDVFNKNISLIKRENKKINENFNNNNDNQEIKIFKDNNEEIKNNNKENDKVCSINNEKKDIRNNKFLINNDQNKENKVNKIFNDIPKNNKKTKIKAIGKFNNIFNINNKNIELN